MGFKRKEKTEETEERKRIIPIDSNNEQYLLGHALNDPSTAVLLDDLDPKQFLFVNHRVLCECVQYALREGLTLDLDTLDSIKAKYEGGAKLTLEYMGQIADVFQGKAAAEDYAHHLKKLKADKVKDVLSVYLLPDLLSNLAKPTVQIDEVLTELATVRDFVEDQQMTSDFRFISARVVDAEHTQILKDREAGAVFQGVGYKRLDRVLTDGYCPKKMTILAGRPGMAKSAFLLNSLLRLACMGIPCAVYNLEMDHISNYDRAVAILAEVPIIFIVKARDKLTPEMRAREKRAKEFLKHLPLYFYTASTQTIAGIRREVRILREKYHVKVVAYDLFKKLRLRGRRNTSTADMLNESLDQMQAMGKDLDVHQILVVQISREAERRKNKRPRMKELKDAGGYEEVADNIFFLYRPRYYQDAEEDQEDRDYMDTEEIEVIVAKQRMGGGNIKVLFDFTPAMTYVSEPEDA